MRRNEECERRPAHRSRDAAMGERVANGARDIRIRRELAEPERRNLTPHGTFERRTFEAKRQRKALQPAREV